MKIASDVFKVLLVSVTRFIVLRVHCRILLLTLFVSNSLLFGIETAQAGDLVQKGQIFNHHDQRKHETPSEYLSSSYLTDLVTAQFEKEVHCLALNIYFEARSEPESGQRAVGHVVMNRVAHPDYPATVCAVVKQGGEFPLHRCQFSWWCDGKTDKPINKKAWAQSMRLSRTIYLGIMKDTTGGALWYHATYTTPYWSKVLRQGDRIGQHIFYLENRVADN